MWNSFQHLQPPFSSTQPLWEASEELILFFLKFLQCDFVEIKTFKKQLQHLGIVSFMKTSI